MFFILFYLNLHIYDYMLFAVPVVICVDVELGKLGGFNPVWHAN